MLHLCERGDVLDDAVALVPQLELVGGVQLLEPAHTPRHNGENDR